METRTLPDNIRYRELSSDALRGAYLADGLFVAGQIRLLQVDVDRQVLGAAVPTNAPLSLQAPPELRASHFCERRELGTINVGGPGVVTVDGEKYPTANRECVYVGRGARQVSFTSDDPANPAAFFLVSFPAHETHPTRHAGLQDARILELGSQEQANRRRLHQYIHVEGIRSCQLVMGFTQMETGSVWNTMPAHTHARRCETYMYFDVPEQHRVLHLMGTPDDTRHLFVANRQAAISPSWSIHSGAGTSAYSFVWAMGGENQSFEDMDGVPIGTLR